MRMPQPGTGLWALWYELEYKPWLAKNPRETTAYDKYDAEDRFSAKRLAMLVMASMDDRCIEHFWAKTELVWCAKRLAITMPLA